MSVQFAMTRVQPIPPPSLASLVTGAVGGAGVRRPPVTPPVTGRDVNTAQEALALGRQALVLNDLEGAAAAFRRFAELTHSAYAYSLLGMAYVRIGDYLRAINALGKSLRLQSRDADVYFSLGSAYLMLEKWPQAIRAFRSVIRLDPADNKPYFYLGYAYAQAGQLERARENYYEAIKRRGEHLAAYHYLARLCLDLSVRNPSERDPMLNEALDLYRQLLEIDPRDAAAHSNIGYLYRQLGNPEAALEEYKKALQIDEGSVLGLLNLGATYFDLKQFDRSRDAYHRAIRVIRSGQDGGRDKLAEANAGVGGALLELYRAQEGDSKDEELLREAEAYLRKALELDPSHFHALSDLGVLLTTLGRFDEAEAAFQKALEVDPHSVVAVYNRRLVRLKSLAAGLRARAEILRSEERLDVGEVVAREAAEVLSGDSVTADAFGDLSPAEVLTVASPAAELMTDHARYVFSARLFEVGLTNSTAAARLAGVPRLDFLLRLGEAGVRSINFDETVAAEAAGDEPAARAARAANLFISDNLPDRFVAGEARPDDSTGGWLVPVLLAYPAIGPIGEVGEIAVNADATTVVDHSPVDEMMSRAQDLYAARRDDLETAVL